MRWEEITWTEKYKMFEVGELITPTSTRCPLASGVYEVEECKAPKFAGEQSMVFVKGHRYGVSTEYLARAVTEEEQ